MRLSNALQRLKVNLNAGHWNRRIWEKGYVGPPLPKVARTGGKQQHPLSQNAIEAARARLYREWNVMQWLANPYLNAEQEAAYLERYGDVLEQNRREVVEAHQRKMPNKPKVTKVNGEVDKKRANVGNMLHSHRTVEDQMKELIRRSRWD